MSRDEILTRKALRQMLRRELLDTREDR